MDNKERFALAEWIIKEAVKAGADEISAVLYTSRGIQVEYRDKKLEKLQESSRNSLELDIYAKKKYSGHSTNDLKKESLQKFIEEAVASTKYLTEDEFRKLPELKYYTEKLMGDLRVRDNHYEKIEPADRLKIASEIEQIALAQSDKIISVTSGYYDNYSEGVRVHSNGFSSEWNETSFSAGASVSVKDENSRPEDWFYASTRFYKDVPSSEVIAKNAVARALKKIGQKKIQSGKYPMIVENRTGGRLLNMLYGPMTARAIQQKSSYLEGMLGQKIASEKLTAVDDPFLQKGLSSKFYDYEGLPLKKRTMIEKGVLRNFYVDNYYGRKLGMEFTSGSPTNIIFEYGNKSMAEMIKEIKKGILVNGFIGGNSNSTTGDFSFGIVGLLIENGAVVHAVNEMNISGNAKEFWNQLVEMGNDPYEYSSVCCPAMMFNDVNFSGL
jgi:PmbA protein